MYYRIIKNDILKNKAITLTITLFVSLAAMLVSLAAILLVNLTGAADSFMAKSETPHFMQMHSGDIDREALAVFGIQNKNVDKFQILEFLNIDGSQILFPQGSLSGNMQDNGLSIQSEKFDYLLDLDGNIINPQDGELYVPISYLRSGMIKIGDKAVICNKEFTAAGYLRDSQMNSTLSSSKRFLISENDFEEIKSFGSMEYLIEFRLKDLSAIGSFETAYAAAGLPSNGPVVTYGLFKVMNGLSDGLMIAILLLVSLLAVAVAFMCIRFTLLAIMEDDYREIGVMKAIGLCILEIRKIYLVKYAAIGLTGSMLGYVLSLAFKGVLTENIRLFMGLGPNAWRASFFAILSVMLVFFAILAYVSAVLKHLREISPAEAIRFGVRQEKNSCKKHFLLSSNRFYSTDVFLGMKDVLERKRLYATMFFIIMIASFILLVPKNLYNTISSKNFSTYMGIGNCDLRIDIQQTDHIQSKAVKILEKMNKDSDVKKAAVYTTKMFRTDKGENIKVELGDHSIFPIAYSAGRYPMHPEEIALSEMNAEELLKQVGDSITLYIGGEEKTQMVCGIYSDITNGGKTAKAVFTDDTADTMWSILSAELVNPHLAGEKAMEYGSQLPYAKVSSMNEYIEQIFGQTISTIKTASYGALVAALLLTVLVTLLFMKLLIKKDRYSIAVMKAVGFSNQSIRRQYAVRSLFVLIWGVLIGTLLANTLGEKLGGLAISFFGASDFEFIINGVSSYLLCPLLMLCAVLSGTIMGTFGAGQIKVCENIKE